MELEIKSQLQMLIYSHQSGDLSLRIIALSLKIRKMACHPKAAKLRMIVAPGISTED